MSKKSTDSYPYLPVIGPSDDLVQIGANSPEIGWFLLSQNPAFDSIDKFAQIPEGNNGQTDRESHI